MPGNETDVMLVRLDDTRFVLSNPEDDQRSGKAPWG